MPFTVVCPLTARPNAERALPTAYDAAQATGAAIELTSAVEDPHMVSRRRSYLDLTGARTRGAGAAVPQTSVVVDPHAPRALADRASSPEVIMVMATSTQPLMHHGYVGSAAEHVLRKSHHPVVLVGPRNQTRLGDVEQVVVACDGSPLSMEMIPDACDWAERLNVGVWIVTVLDPATLGLCDATAQTEANYVRRAAQSINADWDVLHGKDPARTITEWAGPNSLIAMTSHGRSGFSRLTVGSVATGVARWATGPVLVGNQQKRLVD